MRTSLGLAAAFVTAISVNAQEKPIDRYLAESGTIVIAECLKVGPVNILLRANVQVRILHVVKGDETLREITVNSQYGMAEGGIYLLRTKNKPSGDKPYFRIDARDSVIPVSRDEKLDELKALSPRIVVLRTMNLRSYALESKIRTLNHELEAINAVRKD
ncbi:MAG TPA: hypothetical protein VNA17_00515 [Pyrinomonadaceae bacterium]|nr:hypothetical protein [Pyrinomonadaceae bacterium]